VQNLHARDFPVNDVEYEERAFCGKKAHAAVIWTKAALRLGSCVERRANLSLCANLG